MKKLKSHPLQSSLTEIKKAESPTEHEDAVAHSKQGSRRHNECVQDKNYK